MESPMFSCGLCTSILFLFLSSALCAEAKRGPSDPDIKAILEQISSERIFETVETLVSFETRHSLSETGSDRRGVGAARRWIRDEFKRYAKASRGRLNVDFYTFLVEKRRRVPQPTEMKNVVAIQTGRKYGLAERCLVIGGHYDSRTKDPMDSQNAAPGAVDDASGTAVTLEVARVLSQYEFDATIVYIAFAGEEQGLLGSARWASQAHEKGYRIAGMLNNDVVGNVWGQNGLENPHLVRVFSEGIPATETEEEARIRLAYGGESDSSSRQLARYAQAVAEKYLPDLDVMMIFRRDRVRRGGDHLSFNRAGFPAIRFAEPYENYQRQHETVEMRDGAQFGDVLGYFSAVYAARVAKLNAATLASLASAPPPPGNVVIHGAVSPNTTLSWSKVEADDLAGYVVYERATTAPSWEQRRSIGDVDNYTFENMYIDNHFFGVAAIDRAGNESRVVFPKPGEL